MQEKVLRCGIMCNSTLLKAWQRKAIEELISSGTATIELIIINNNKKSSPPAFFHKIKSRKAFYNFYYNRYIKADALQETDSTDLFTMVPQIFCTPTVNGPVNYFCEEDINFIKACNLDFIIRFGFNILHGDILNSAKYGVWSYHHGDESVFRGGPPAFWEIFYNKPVTGAVLQQLTEKLDAGIVLKKGYFKTINHSYKETLNTILWQSAVWIAQVSKQIIHNNEINRLNSETKAQIYTYPGNLITLLFLLKLFINKIKFHLKDLLLVEQWNFGVIEQNLEDFMMNGLKPASICFPLQGEDSFAADAFGFSENNVLHILFEKYNYRKKKAHIAALKYLPEKKLFIEGSVAISSEHHLAYPYVFKIDNEIYCLPEGNYGNYFLYKFENNKWEKMKIEFPEKDLIDCTIIYYNEYYWLFSTRISTGSNLNLHIYYSKTFPGDFKPHLLNPVKTDIRSARPAGTPFIYNNDLYRPSQDSSETYGGQLRINKITCLSPTCFSEESFRTISTFHKIFDKGIHTFAVAGNFILIDFKRFIFSPDHFLYKLKSRFKIK